MNRESFRKKYNWEYKWLLKNNLANFNEVFPHKVKTKTKNECISDALNYNSVSEWAKGKNTSYSSARKYGWMTACTKHMSKRFVWTIGLCKKDALKCKTKAEWKFKYPNSYSAAKKKGFVLDCCKHMVNGRLKKNRNIWGK